MERDRRSLPGGPLDGHLGYLLLFALLGLAAFAPQLLVVVLFVAIILLSSIGPGGMTPAPMPRPAGGGGSSHGY